MSATGAMQGSRKTPQDYEIKKLKLYKQYIYAFWTIRSWLTVLLPPRFKFSLGAHGRSLPSNRIILTMLN